jgi:2-polyprenyl-3-methyl-5-hydroxy-6-metoxy-1,4-benzoquinol methylase
MSQIDDDAGTRDSREDRCPICSSPAADVCRYSGPDRLEGTPGTFCVALCSVCGGGWTLPLASTDDLPHFYRGSYYAYALASGPLATVQRVGQEALLRRGLRRPPLDALAHVQAGALLDVGCGRGDLGAWLVRRGWRVAGVEPSAEACRVARSRGVEAQIGTLDSVGFPDESFDAVVMSHSLEHVVDPVADLRRIACILRPGGLALVSLPNFGSWQRRRFGARWFPLDLPRHRTHFVPRSLHQALSSAGLEVVSIGSQGDLGSLFSSVQYRIAGRLLLTSPAAGWTGMALSLVLSPLTALLDRAGGGGPELYAIARRAGGAPK